MGDPDLRSDETVLVRTQGVFVKSIPFEGILTNKRIVLIDRAKNLLPLKEIPLATIKDIEGGENAIRDPVITVTVITRTGETRQMILTFSRTAGGNRGKERDEWVKILKENVSSSFEQVIRKGIPGTDQAGRRSEPAPYPRIEVTGIPVQPAAARPVPKEKVPDTPVPGFGTFCSRCGNRVPEGSGFCNRCGSAIIPPIFTAPLKPPVPDYQVPVQRPIDREIRTIEPLIERSTERVSPYPLGQKTAERSYSPLYDNPPEPVEPLRPAPPVTPPQQKPAKKGLIPRLFSPKERSPTPLTPASMPAAEPPAPKKPRGAGRMPGKKVFMAIGVIILLIAIVVAGVVFVYPMISASGSPLPGAETGVPETTSTPAISPTLSTSSTPLPSGTLVIPRETTAPVVPATGVYAHVSYLGSWKGTYGIPAALETVTYSGDRFLEILNATGRVEASFEKLDGSTRHELVVEIYKNGGLLTRGNTSAGFGKVAVSANA
jgi:hypothetical protein